MPSWIDAGVADYLKRFPKDCQVELKPLGMSSRNKGANISSLVDAEGEKLLSQCQKNSIVVALNPVGASWSTEVLSDKMTEWRREGGKVDLLIGGPDGLSQSCLDSAHCHWSLSPLTFPHALVRIIVAEQLYRAWSIINHHPYHRG